MAATPGTALAVYDKIDSPLAFAAEMAEPVAALIGCDARQGKAMALYALCEGLNPMQLHRRYHWIQGKPTMQAAAMLAEFRMNWGGDYEIVERSSTRAAIKLIDSQKRTYEFEFTRDDAQQSRWPWAKGKGPGNPWTPENLKDNWSTPIDQRNMLWVRLVSDSLRAVCPELVAGIYTPEEMVDVNGATTEPVKAAPKKGFMETVATETTVSVVDPIALADGDEPAAEEAEFEVKTDQPTDPSAPGSVRFDQRQLIENLTAELFGEKAVEAREGLLKKRNAQSLHNLSINQADEIVERLLGKQRELRKAASPN